MTEEIHLINVHQDKNSSLFHLERNQIYGDTQGLTNHGIEVTQGHNHLEVEGFNQTVKIEVILISETGALQQHLLNQHKENTQSQVKDIWKEN